MDIFSSCPLISRILIHSYGSLPNFSYNGIIFIFTSKPWRLHLVMYCWFVSLGFVVQIRNISAVIIYYGSLMPAKCMLKPIMSNLCIGDLSLVAFTTKNTTVSRCHMKQSQHNKCLTRQCCKVKAQGVWKSIPNSGWYFIDISFSGWTNSKECGNLPTTEPSAKDHRNRYRAYPRALLCWTSFS